MSFAPVTSRCLHAKYRGFTLIELMVGLSVAAIVGLFVVPAMSAFAANAALRGTSYDLMAAITLARSEAIKHMGTVIVCRSAEPMASSPSCGGADDWSPGWLVFLSKDTDDDYDTATDLLLMTGTAAGVHARVRADADAADFVKFRADGTLAAAGAAQFAICDERGAAYGKRIDLALVGRPELVSGSADSPLDTCEPGA